jgi:CheY-like chemotaxis protein
MGIVNYDLVYVDDEGVLANLFCGIAKTMCPGKRIKGYTSPKLLLNDLENNRIVTSNLLLDLMMREMNGIELAKKLRNLCGDQAKIYFYTALPSEAVSKYSRDVEFNGVFFKGQHTPQYILEKLIG